MHITQPELLHFLIRVLSILVFLGALGDFASTRLALSAPGTAEGNPVIAFLMRVLGPAWIIPRLCLALLQITLVIVLKDRTWTGVGGLSIGVAIAAFAIWSNLRLWRRNRVNSV